MSPSTRVLFNDPEQQLLNDFLTSKQLINILSHFLVFSSVELGWSWLGGNHFLLYALLIDKDINRAYLLRYLRQLRGLWSGSQIARWHWSKWWDQEWYDHDAWIELGSLNLVNLHYFFNDDHRKIFKHNLVKRVLRRGKDLNMHFKFCWLDLHTCFLLTFIFFWCLNGSNGLLIIIISIFTTSSSSFVLELPKDSN